MATRNERRKRAKERMLDKLSMRLVREEASKQGIVRDKVIGIVRKNMSKAPVTVGSKVLLERSKGELTGKVTLVTKTVDTTLDQRAWKHYVHSVEQVRRKG